MMHPSLAKQKPLVDFDKKSELVIKKIFFFFFWKARSTNMVFKITFLEKFMDDDF